MATTAKKTTKTNTDAKRVKDLEAQVAQLTEMVQLLTKSGLTNIQPAANDTDRDVVITSLTSGMLNLSTLGMGQGTIYTFDKFGEEQVIPYEDAKLIIKNNKSFVEGGNFFINDDDLIASQRLTKVYKKILNADQMMNLFKENKKEFKTIFSNMTNGQKETFCNIIYDKLRNDQDVDMNIIQIVNDELNIDIINNFKANKELLSEEQK